MKQAYPDKRVDDEEEVVNKSRLKCEEQVARNLSQLIFEEKQLQEFGRLKWLC
jgi:hypothetical protein